MMQYFFLMYRHEIHQKSQHQMLKQMFLGVTFFRNCVKMYTLDSGIDVAHGINGSHGIFGKNIKY